ncbi:hypothetical protein ACRS81_12490 [Stutzerimonas stutzeri]|uniref:hypothetical protein n=1 Tax=Stutzerimonas stutzeri TaxID=316 RepID=UPI003EE0346E
MSRRKRDDLDGIDWSECVARLLGPQLPSDPPDRRRRHALELAAAALPAVGRDDLVATLQL